MSSSPEIPSGLPVPAAHAPPRGLRLMAIVRWSLLAAIIVLAGGTWWTLVFHPHPTTQGPDRYYCGMHPQIRSPDPGNCPICGMRLELIPTDHHGAISAPSASAPAFDVATDLAPISVPRDRRQAIGVATSPVTKTISPRTLRLPASIDVPDGSRVEVHVRAPGYVEQVADVERGTAVRAGQALAWVYVPTILRAEEELLVASRWKAIDLGVPLLEGSGASSGPRREPTDPEAGARRQLELLGLSGNSVDAMLAKQKPAGTLALSSPIAGIVTRRNVVRGAYAVPETALFEIADLSRVWVVASADASAVADLELGESNASFLRAGGGAPIALTLDLIEPEIATDTRTRRIRYRPRDKTALLGPGDIGEVVASSTARERIVVPRDAVIDTGLARYVFVERSEDTFAPVKVETGGLMGEEREILSGLEVGWRVVSRGAFMIDSESRLQASLTPKPFERAAPKAPETMPGMVMP